MGRNCRTCVIFSPIQTAGFDLFILVMIANRFDRIRQHVSGSAVESGPFANSMSDQGDHAFDRVKAAKRDTASTAVSSRQTLYPTLLSGAVTFEAPQVGGVLQSAAAGEASDQNDPDDYVTFEAPQVGGVLQSAAAGEASDQNDPDDYDSDDTSDGGDEIAGAPRTLQQKKKRRMKRRDRYMSVRRASPLGDLDPRGGTRRLIAQLRTTPGM